MNTLNAEILNKLQDCELSILKDFHKYCCEHNLQYYLIGGALLGSARYKHFIPWDDDVDVAMPREDYDKMIELSAKNPIPGYFLQNGENDKNFARCIMKLRKEGTHIIEKGCADVKMHNGIYIDIFPIDYLPKNKLDRVPYQAWIIRRLMSFRAVLSGYISGRFLFLKKLILLLFGWIDPQIVEKSIHYICTKYNEEQRDYAILWLHNYDWKHQLHSIDVFGSQGQSEFCGLSFKAPQLKDAFLRRVFGEDYLNEPPEEKRVNPHCYISVDFGRYS